MRGKGGSIKVECIREFHSKLCPDEKFGVLFAVYEVELARYRRGCQEPAHYKMFEGIDNWVNAERFKVIA